MTPFEEKLRHQLTAAQARIKELEVTASDRTISDGFGSTWLKCGRPSGCRMQVVRPGKVQCDCEYENEKETQP